MKDAFEPMLYSGLDLRTSLDIATYRSIMHVSMWDKVRRAIVATRAYEAGIDAALLLLRFTEQNLKALTLKERNDYRVQLYLLVLNCLDRLDRWEEYLDVWNQLRRNTSLETGAYARDVVYNSRLAERSRPFILRETANYCYFHFLRNTCRRKELIEQKLARRLAGKKVRNLLHRRREELSEGDILERLRRLKELFAREDEMRRYWENYWRFKEGGASCESASRDRKRNNAFPSTRILRSPHSARG